MNSHRFTSGLVCIGMACGLVISGCQKASPSTPVTANSPLPTQNAPAQPEAIKAPPSTSEPIGVAKPEASVANPDSLTNSGPVTAVQAEGMSIRASAEWDAPYVFGDPPNPLPLPKVEVKLLIEGGAAREIFSIGKLRINQAIVGGRVLRIDLSESQSTISEMMPVQRMNEPENGVDLHIDFIYPGEPIESISSLSGEVDVTFAEKTQTITGIKVGDLLHLAEKEPLLKEIEFSVAPPLMNILDKLDYVLTTGPVGVVSNFEVKDSAGSNSFDFGSGDFPLTGGCRFEDSFDEEEIKNNTVSFTVASGLRRVTIPFEYREIPVAAFKTTSKNQVGLPSPELGKASMYYPSETNPTLPKGLRVDGQIGWSPQFDYLKPDHPANPRVFAAFVELSGPVARTVRRTESVSVTKCVTDGGELTFQPPNNYELPVYRTDFNKTPVSDGRPVSVKLPFEPPQNPVKLCQELSGEVAVIFTESEETLEFELHDPEGPLEHPTFNKLGITARYQLEVPEDPSEEDTMRLKVVLSMPDREHLGRLFLSSAVDKSFLSSIGIKSEDGGTEYTTLYNAGKHPKPRLVMDLVTQFKREKVPFRFLNLPISAPPPAKP